MASIFAWDNDHPYGLTSGSGNAAWQRAGSLASAAKRRARGASRTWTEDKPTGLLDRFFGAAENALRFGMTEQEYWSARMQPTERALTAWETNDEEEFVAALQQMPAVPTQDLRKVFYAQDDAAFDELIEWIPDAQDFAGLREAYVAKDEARFLAILSAYPDANAHELIGRFQSEESVLSFVNSMPAWFTGARLLKLGTLPAPVSAALKGKGYAGAAATMVWDAIKLAAMGGTMAAGQAAVTGQNNPAAIGLDAARQTLAFAMLARIPVVGSLVGVGTMSLMSILEYGLDPAEAGKQAIAQAVMLTALNPGHTRQSIKQLRLKLMQTAANKKLLATQPEYGLPDTSRRKLTPDERIRLSYHRDWKHYQTPERALMTVNEARARYRLKPLTLKELNVPPSKQWPTRALDTKPGDNMPLKNAGGSLPATRPPPSVGHPYGLTRGSGNAAWQRAGTAASAARRSALARLRKQLPALERDEQGHMSRTHTTTGAAWRDSITDPAASVPVRNYRVRFEDGSFVDVAVHAEQLAATAGYLKRYARNTEAFAPVAKVDYMGRAGREITAAEINEHADIIDNLWDEFYRLHPTALHKDMADIRTRAVAMSGYTPETLHLAPVPAGLEKVDILTKENIFHAGMSAAERAGLGRRDRGPVYLAAKTGGDIDASLQVAHEFVPDHAARALASKYKGATLMPLLAAESGKNVLPLGLALRLSEVGLRVEEAVMQQTVDGGSHTGKDMAHRLSHPAKFSVTVTPGQKVVLVDDITTSGMTLAEAAKAVEYAGGKVVGAIAYGQVSNFRTGARGDQIKVLPETLERLERIHGNLDTFAKQLASMGVSGPLGLSDSAARYLASFRSSDALRLRIADPNQSGIPSKDSGTLQNRARTWLGVLFERAGRRIAERRAARQGMTHKIWVTHPDEKTCPECSAMDGAIAAIGEDFPGYSNPPAHHYCRCSVRYEKQVRHEGIEIRPPIAPWPRRASIANASLPATRVPPSLQPSQSVPARMGSHPYGLTRGSGNAAWQRAGTLAAAAKRRALDSARRNPEAQYRLVGTSIVRNLNRTVSTLQAQGMLTDQQLAAALTRVGVNSIAELDIAQASDFGRFLQSLSLVEAHRYQIRTAVRAKAPAIAERVDAAREVYRAAGENRLARGAPLLSAQHYFDGLQKQSGVPLGDIFQDLKTYRRDLEYRAAQHPEYFRTLLDAFTMSERPDFKAAAENHAAWKEMSDLQFTYEQLRSAMLRDGFRRTPTTADIQHYYYKSKMGDMLQAFDDHVTIYESRFKNPAAIHKAVGAVSDSLTLKPSKGGLLEAVGSSIYSQVALTLFNNPALAVRNLLQLPAYYTRPEEMAFVRNVSADDRTYYDRQASQSSAIKRDLLAITESPRRVGDFLPYVQELNAIADTLRLMDRTDFPTRYGAFAMKLGATRAAVAKNPNYATDPAALDALVKQSGLSELTTPVQLRALDKLGSEGVDAFARYTAEAITSRVNFDYDRYARAPAAQGSSLAQAIDNLAVFARSRVTMVVQDAQKLASPTERAAASSVNSTAGRTALRALLGSAAGAYIADAISKELTGSKRDSYQMGEQTIGLVNIGGLMYEGTSRAADFSENILRAVVKGDKKALNRAIEDIPELKSYFLPVADTMLNMYQAIEGFDDIDKYAVRQLRAKLDSSYKARGIEAYKVKRSPAETVKEFFFGKGMEKPKPKATSADSRTQYEKMVDSRTITMATKGEAAYIHKLKADGRFDPALVDRAAAGDLTAATELRRQARRVDAQKIQGTPDL